MDNGGRRRSMDGHPANGGAPSARKVGFPETAGRRVGGEGVSANGLAASQPVANGTAPLKA